MREDARMPWVYVHPACRFKASQIACLIKYILCQQKMYTRRWRPTALKRKVHGQFDKSRLDSWEAGFEMPHFESLKLEPTYCISVVGVSVSDIGGSVST